MPEFLLGVIVIIAGFYLIGSLIILAISVTELSALFQAQRIVQAYNNDVMEKIYQELTQKLIAIEKRKLLINYCMIFLMRWSYAQMYCIFPSVLVKNAYSKLLG